MIKNIDTLAKSLPARLMQAEVGGDAARYSKRCVELIVEAMIYVLAASNKVHIQGLGTFTRKFHTRAIVFVPETGNTNESLGRVENKEHPFPLQGFRAGQMRITRKLPQYEHTVASVRLELAKWDKVRPEERKPRKESKRSAEKQFPVPAATEHEQSLLAKMQRQLVAVRHKNGRQRKNKTIEVDAAVKEHVSINIARLISKGRPKLG